MHTHVRRPGERILRPFFVARRGVFVPPCHPLSVTFALGRLLCISFLYNFDRMRNGDYVREEAMGHA